MENYNFRRISSSDANTNVVVCAGPCKFGRVIVNTTSAHALTFYDHNTTTVTSATKIATLKASVVEGSFTYEVMCTKGLVVEIPASYAGDATITFRPGL